MTLRSDAVREGTIYKATGGFYYVITDGGADLECRARGIFREQGVKPLVGDRVRVETGEDGSGVVDEILPRRNDLVRPPLANLDYMVVVLSVTDPAPNLFVVDKYIAVLEHKGIEPVVAVTKSDLDDPEPLAAIYRGAGFPVFVTDCVTLVGINELTAHLAGLFGAFSGNSGVGKSSLLNAIDPALGIQTGGTSRKLGRGKHTTRHVETFKLPNGALVADTPGFTSLELVRMSDITKENLSGCFREFARFAGGCRFMDCSHTCENGCAVLVAVEDGQIARSRHESYLQMYNEIKDVKEWERR